MENVFNGLAWLLLLFEKDDNKEQLNKKHRMILFVPRIFALFSCYIIASLCAIFLILPACFVLLIVRTAKVELKEVAFAQRQIVLEKEDMLKKTFRFLSILIRAIPMLFLLVGWPLLAIYYLIPKFGVSQLVVTTTIGSHTGIIVILQFLGLYRAFVSYRTRNIENLQEKKISTHPMSPRIFRWLLPANIIALFSMLFESLQIVGFSFQSVNTDFADDSYTFFNAIYLHFDNFSNYTEFLIWSSMGITILLCLVFLCRFLYEVRRFGILKLRLNKKDEANKFFFFSFIGSIIYGHGELRGVSSYTSTLVIILSDGFLLLVCSKLIAALSCSYTSTPPTLLLDPSIICWEGSHRLMAAFSLISFAVYVPLSTMIAPIITESTSNESTEREIDHANSETSEKDIRFSQPYLSLLAISKCTMVVIAAFFASSISYALTEIIVCIFLFAITWWWISYSPLSSAYGRTGITLPCRPLYVCIWKSILFLTGVWGAVIALSTSYNLSFLNNFSVKITILLVGSLVLFMCGLLWYILKKFSCKVPKLIIVSKDSILTYDSYHHGFKIT